MATENYNRMWASAVSELAALARAEDPAAFAAPGAPAEKAPPAMTAPQAYEHARRSYLRYLLVFHTLERCFEGITHPQKRQDVARLLESVLAKLCQMRAIVAKWAPFNPEVAACLKGKPLRSVPNEYAAYDDLLAEMKLQPESLEVPPPRLFVDDRAEELRKRDQLISGYMILKLGVERVLVELEPQQVDCEEASLPQLAPADAVEMILRAERGRQGAQRVAALRQERAVQAKALEAAKKAAARAKAVFDEAFAAAGGREDGGPGDGSDGLEEDEVQAAAHAAAKAAVAAHAAATAPRRVKHAPTGEDGEDPDDLLTPREAATAIQRIVRGFTARRRAERERAAELRFLGMRDGPRPGLRGLEQALGGVVAGRLRTQAEHKEGLAKALPEVHKLVLEEEGPEVRDKLKAVRLAWFTSQLATGEVPEDLSGFYAAQAAAAGGGADAEAEAKAKAEAEAKAKAGAGKADPKKDAKGKGGPPEPEPEKPPTLLGPSAWTKQVAGLVAEYRDKWEGRDERDNSAQRYDESLARVVVRPAVSEELRVEVDAALADQLANFKAAQADKKKDKKKKEKKPKEKKVKVKPLPGAKLCTGMDIDAMLAELVQNRVVNNPRASATFATFVGGAGSLGTAYNAKDTPAQRHPVTKHWMPADPSMQQVRESLMVNAVLPLGSPAVRQQLEDFCAAQLIGARPRAPRAILLYGPTGTGKTHLAQAVATACGAIFFNLSAGNTEGKFTEKDGMKKLLHMAFEVAKDRSLGPAVIYIDEVEKMIPGPPPKGKPKPDPNGPARFKKDLPIYINSLAAEHSCIVIASSSCPEEADPKSVADCFDRFVFTPTPDYATRLLLWRQELQAAFSVVPTELKAEADRRAKLEARAAAKSAAAAEKAAEEARAAGKPPPAAAAAAPVVDASPWATGEPSNAAAPSAEALAAAGAAPLPLTAGFGPLPMSMAAAFASSEELHPMLRDFGLNLPALASVSNGYSVGAIRAAVRATLNLRRLDRLDDLPLAEADFINQLARQPRVYKEDAERFADFGARVTGLEAARSVVAEDPGAKKKK